MTSAEGRIVEGRVAEGRVTAEPKAGDARRSAMRSMVAALNRMLPRSLLGRSLLIIITPLILLQVVSTWVFYDSHWETVTRRLAGSIAGDIAAVIALMEEVSGPEHYPRIFAVAEETMQLEMTLAPGKILRLNPLLMRETLVDRKLATALANVVRRPFLIDTRSLEKYVEIQVQLPDGVLHIVAPRRRLFSSTTYVFILWMVGTSLVLFAVATVFMRNQVRPIRRLAAAVDDFGKGRETGDFRIEGATEVRQVAAAFNLMRNRITRQITQRTEMLAGVSHDLRTPLTRMKLQLAMLPDSPDTADLKADVAEMEKMVGGYLAFARGEGTEQPVEVDLSALLKDVVGSARREGTTIDLHTEEDPLMMRLRPDAFRRCVGNLIANAQRYARTVSVRAGHRGAAVEVTIDDDGPGIPPEQREEVFRPFYRLDQSRNSETGGIGLGLTIARDVMRSHGGELALAESPSGGLRARLRLPV
jgi:two-component system, OmpR family, osmolarity sensor histidine kinase EnvZ